MAEENQQQVQQVTTKNPKKVEAGKRLAAHNRRIKEGKKMKSEATSGVSQYYGIGAVTAVGVIGGLGYYIYRTKKGEASGEVKDVSIPHNPTQQPSPLGEPCPPWSGVPAGPKPNKFEMDLIFSAL